MSPFSPEERALLAPYVTSLDDGIYVLRGLPEEVVAVLFAYYSRSRDDLRTNLLRLLRDQELAVSGTPSELDESELILARQKAREFHEKWVVGYGHASVAEHAVAHVAVEDLSIVASKVIEDCRLASYTEKSTRYVPFPRRYCRDPGLPTEAAADYAAIIEGLFDVYEELLPLTTDAVMATADRSAYKTDRGFEGACRAQACDALRYLLPAATYTNIGLTANARTLEHMISKLLSHDLPELRDAGERIRRETTKVIPTLIKYARANAYWMETLPAIGELADAAGLTTPSAGAPSAVRLVSGPSEDEATARLAAAILYPAAACDYDTVWARVSGWSQERRQEVVERYLAGRRTYGSGGHGYTDPPLRGLEHAAFTFEITVDYGAYRDIQRHRMATQTTQTLGCALGWETPGLLVDAGFGGRFAAAMEAAAAGHARLAALNPTAAQYVVPLAFRTRVLFTWNLRELHHFISLRSARQGHTSYRRVAQQCYRALESSHPFLAGFIKVDLEEYELARPG